MYIKFTTYDPVDAILRARRALKDTGFSIHEDTTPMNIQLIKRLNKYKEDNGKVESAWYARGKVWAPTKNNHRVNFEILDNIDDKLRAPQAKRPSHFIKKTHATSTNAESAANNVTASTEKD